MILSVLCHALSCIDGTHDYFVLVDEIVLFYADINCKDKNETLSFPFIIGE
jgi:hypothetical protein